MIAAPLIALFLLLASAVLIGDFLLRERRIRRARRGRLLERIAQLERERGGGD